MSSGAGSGWIEPGRKRASGARLAHPPADGTGPAARLLRGCGPGVPPRVARGCGPGVGLLAQPRLALGLLLFADARLTLASSRSARLPRRLGRFLLLADTGLARRFLGREPVALARSLHAAAAVETRPLIRLHLEGLDPLELALEHDRGEPVDQRPDIDLASRRGHRAAPGKADIGRRSGPALRTGAARQRAARVERQRLEIDRDRALARLPVRDRQRTGSCA